MTDPVLELTEDAFLGGQLRLKQLKSGHRAGHDAVLLAAATAARPGDRVADLGAGAGVAGLAVARRVAGIDLVLVEIDAALAGLARANADANAIHADVIVLDVEADAAAFAAAGLAPDSVDAVLMNPPFNDPARHRVSPDTARGIAHMATATTLCEMGSRGAAHSQIEGSADADLARRWNCRGALGARSRFRELAGPAGSRRRAGACQPHPGSGHQGWAGADANPSRPDAQ